MDPRGRAVWVPGAVALLVFAAALGFSLRGWWGADPTRSVPLTIEPGALLADGGLPSRPLHEADHRFSVWLVARNAHAWLHHPWRIFEAEPCAPAHDALALGEPALTLGLLGAPAWLLSGDPVLTFDAVLLASLLLAPLAMFLLVREWTGSAAAGIVAGLLYGLHHDKIFDLIHPYVYDSTWTVLALLFARRLFERARWRDALGLALCCALQIGGSLYALAYAAVLALALVPWLARGRGAAPPLLLRLAAVAIAVALAAALVFGPYLALRGEGTLHARALRVFMRWRDLAPGGRFFYGAVLLALAAAGLALGRPRSGRDPRWLLAVAAAVILLLATTGRFYRLVAGWIPGLDVLRNPAGLHLGTHLALCILAGYGAAALLRLVPLRLRTAAAAALIALAAVDVLRPPLLGLAPPLVSRAVEIRPDAEAIALFGRLEGLGNAGPLLEVPIYPGNVRGTTESVLLSAYHHRRTSACYNSYTPPEVERARVLAARLPDPAALDALREQGFTTIVVHHPPGHIAGRLQLRGLEGLAGEEGGHLLQRIARTRSLTVYAIRAPPPGS